jgi:hypothetical protein
LETEANHETLRGQDNACPSGGSNWDYSNYYYYYYHYYFRMSKSRRMRWAGYVVLMGKKRNTYTVLVGKPKGKRTLGRHRCRWEDNINMEFREIRWDGMD